MTITGILLSVIAALVAFAIGGEYGERIGDQRGIVAYGLAALVLVAGLCWTFGL